MYQPVKTIKQQVQERITCGDINIGENILITSYPRYVERGGEIREETIKATAQKIPLIDIRKKLLKIHEDLGII